MINSSDSATWLQFRYNAVNLMQKRNSNQPVVLQKRNYTTGCVPGGVPPAFCLGPYPGGC